MNQAARIATLLSLLLIGAKATSPNFVVEAPTVEIAQRVAAEAESQRRRLAHLWVGREYRPWSSPCRLTVQVLPGRPSGGYTQFMFSRGEVFGWRMVVAGDLEAIIAESLPHEVNHTIFATYFRQPLPRCFDEGASVLVESSRAQDRMRQLLQRSRNQGSLIGLSRMVRMMEYPKGRELSVYLQGHSVVEYLVALKGHREYMRFLSSGLQRGWDAAVQHHYRIASIDALERNWLAWIREGKQRFEADFNFGFDASRSPARLALPAASVRC